jgi:hypothetical protein
LCWLNVLGLFDGIFSTAHVMQHNGRTTVNDKLERKWPWPVIIPAFSDRLRKMIRHLGQNIWHLKSRFKPETFWIGSKTAMHSVMTFSCHVFGYSKNVQYKV